MSELFFSGPPDGIHGTERTALFCPRCGSPKTQAKNHAKRIGGALGTCIGAVNSLSGITKGAAAGATISLRTVGPSTPMNSLTVAVLGAFVGGAIGCATGAALGQIIDETVFNNHLCLRCSHSFPAP